MEKSSDSLNNPRQNAIELMKSSLTLDQWESNSIFTSRLKKQIKLHPICKHPIIKILREGMFDIEAVQEIHLEYRHAIVQIFTDTLLMAQAQARQIEPRLPPGSKMAPRFLLTLNTLDEFGFQPGLDQMGYYRGNPRFAHYPLFEKVLDALGVDHQQRAEYVPSAIAKKLNWFLANSFDDYTSMLALLAAAEEQVIIFSPALRQATAATGINVDDGYYHVHGTSDNTDTNAHDDDHEDDLWAALNQACTTGMYEKLEKVTLSYLDLWQAFWTEQQSLKAATQPEAAQIA